MSVPNIKVRSRQPAPSVFPRGHWVEVKTPRGKIVRMWSSWANKKELEY